MKKLYHFIFIFSLVVWANTSFAQLAYDDDVCLDKTPRQLRNKEAQKSLVKGLGKTLTYVSFLSYSDRVVDHAITGKDEFEPYRGKTIHNVDIQILQPYGVSIEKPEADHYTKFQKFANGIQVQTKEWVIRNDLLFHPGDKLDPILFADTEKNLWERETFKDLKIFILPVDGSDDLVDVLVMVQARWSWNLNTTVTFDHLYAGIQFKNFLGLPHTITVGMDVNYRKDNPYGLYASYLLENIKRSHIDMQIKGTYQPVTKGGKLSITRDFFSANSKWAGHIKAAIYNESSDMPNVLAASIPTHVFYNWQDLWLATSLKLPGKLGGKYDLMRLIFSGRMNRYDYIRRPFLRSADGSQTFLNRTYFLGSVGFANWDYYIDHSVYYLGQAEYFNKGLNGALILGFDYDEELQKRFYSGVQLDYGKQVEGAGYSDTRISYGGFTKKDSYQQILLKFSEKFHTTATKMGKNFFTRQFISGTVNLGFNRPIGHELVLNSLSGLRGIFVNYIRGTRSYVFNLESDVYPTFKILGFTSCAFIFADIAIVQQNSFGSNEIKQGYGTGILLRNLKMGIGLFEISFAYYPKLNIPGVKPYTFLGDYKNRRAIGQENLFVPEVLTTDY